MTAPQPPWHGVLVATALPMHDRGGKMLEIDFDGYAEHVRWLAANGCHGVTPNGSLGEYHNLTPEERTRVVTTAIEAAPDGFTVMPGIAAYGADESRRWTEQAAEAGAPAVMLLPPTAARAPDITAKGPRSVYRSSPTTTRSTPRSTWFPTCWPNCSTRA